MDILKHTGQKPQLRAELLEVAGDQHTDIYALSNNPEVRAKRVTDIADYLRNYDVAYDNDLKHQYVQSLNYTDNLREKTGMYPDQILKELNERENLRTSRLNLLIKTARTSPFRDTISQENTESLEADIRSIARTQVVELIQSGHVTGTEVLLKAITQAESEAEYANQHCKEYKVDPIYWKEILNRTISQDKLVQATAAGHILSVLDTGFELIQGVQAGLDQIASEAELSGITPSQLKIFTRLSRNSRERNRFDRVTTTSINHLISFTVAGTVSAERCVDSAIEVATEDSHTSEYPPIEDLNWYAINICNLYSSYPAQKATAVAKIVTCPSAHILRLANKRALKNSNIAA